MQWSWRRHVVVCALLVGVLIPLGVADELLLRPVGTDQPDARGLLLVPAALWAGGVCAMSTALIALWKPNTARAWQSYVIAGLLTLIGLGGLSVLADRLGTQRASGDRVRAQAIADTIVLDALTVTDSAASAVMTLAAPTRLRHITLRSQDGFCEGTEWPAEAEISGGHTFTISLRCAGGVSAVRSWRLSTIAEQAGETATLVWSDGSNAAPNAIVRPLP